MCPHCSPQPSLLHTPTDGQSKGMLGRQEDPSQGTFLALEAPWMQAGAHTLIRFSSTHPVLDPLMSLSWLYWGYI